MCAEILWSYCSDNHTTPEQVCQQMDWTSLASDGFDDDDGDSNDDAGESEADGGV
jgi:hypothetical protein